MNRNWKMRLAGAGIWVMAGLTWGSIGHYLFGLPDFGFAVGLIAAVTVLAWPNPSRVRNAPGLNALASATQAPGLTKADFPSGR